MNLLLFLVFSTTIFNFIVAEFPNPLSLTETGVSLRPDLLVFPNKLSLPEAESEDFPQ